MEIGTSLSFPFRGEAWPRRLLAGAALELTPVLLSIPVLLIAADSFHRRAPLVWGGLFLLLFLALASRLVLLGYLRRVVQGTLAGSQEGLPPWNRLDEDLLEGLKLWLVAIGLLLPGIGVTTALVVLAGIAAGQWEAWLVVVLVGPPAVLATAIYLPAGLLAALAAGEAGAAFHFRSVVRHLGTVAGPYLLAALVAVTAEILAQLGLVLVCVGIFPARFLAHCIGARAFASAWRSGMEPGVERVIQSPEGE
jgi:branched-subunit amino acid transport protein